MLTGFVCVADIKSIGNRKYARLVQHQYDGNAKTYTVINKAVSQNEQGFGGELPLSVIKEWADIEPEITFTGVDQIPFGYVDSPKDNRNADKLQGASITFGCEGTIAEIHETIRQYMIEFDHKRSVLGVDRSMLDPEAMRLNGGHAAIAQEHILTETVGKLGTGTSDLFSVYSPDIRDQAYRDRLLHLFARLEKQVGTSSGILTPADTSMATATQVRRAMYDTWAMVGRMRASIEACMHSVAYGYYVMLSVVGTPVQEYTLTFDWSDDLLTDSAEQFTQISQGHSAGVVSDVEYRRFFYPNESPEEAQKALDEINKNKPEPFDIFSPEPFGDESGVIE
jgi:A118 family predicted phage portal protein